MGPAGTARHASGSDAHPIKNYDAMNAAAFIALPSKRLAALFRIKIYDALKTANAAGFDGLTWTHDQAGPPASLAEAG